MTKNFHHDKASESKHPLNGSPKNSIKEVCGATLGSSNESERKDQLSAHNSDHSIVAVDLPAPESSIRSVDYSLASVSQSSIDVQLLLTHGKVKKGKIEFPDDFELLRGKSM